MTKSSNTTESTSGTVLIDGDKIIWKSKGKIVSEIEMKEVVVIGEYTTTAGPWMDDWFLVFVKKDGSFFHIPFYVDGREILINFIQDKLSPKPLIGLLVGSTQWKTVINYPEVLKDKSLFQLSHQEKYGPLKTWIIKMLYGLGLQEDNTEVLLSEAVQDYLTACH